MAIDPSKLGLNANLATSQTRTSAHKTARSVSDAAPVSAPVKQDSVSLTAESRSVTRLSQQTSEAPASFDADKVAQLQKAISDGSYQINPEKVAQKMLSFESSL